MVENGDFEWRMEEIGMEVYSVSGVRHGENGEWKKSEWKFIPYGGITQVGTLGCRGPSARPARVRCGNDAT